MKNIADESTQSVELREKIDLGTKTIEKESYRERERERLKERKLRRQLSP